LLVLSSSAIGHAVIGDHARAEASIPLWPEASVERPTLTAAALIDHEEAGIARARQTAPLERM
jgi:hypothetical protein